MTFKDWGKLTEEEAAAILLEIIESLGDDAFEAFCVENPDDRTGVMDGVIELTPEKEDKYFCSYMDRNTTKKLINELVVKRYKEIAYLLANNVPTGQFNIISETPITYEHFEDGTIKYNYETIIGFVRDFSQNPCGYGFILVP